MHHFVDIRSSDGFSLPAYVAHPIGPARGGVVVLQEIFGVNAHIRATADAYAAQGYLAVAPATFHRVRADVELGYTPDDIAQGVALKAAVEGLPTPGCCRTFRPPSPMLHKQAKWALWGFAGVVCWLGGRPACCPASARPCLITVAA